MRTLTALSSVALIGSLWTRERLATVTLSAIRSAAIVLVLMSSEPAFAGEQLPCVYTPKTSVDRFAELFEGCAVRAGEEIRIRKKHFEALDFGTTGRAQINILGVGSYYVLPDGTKAVVIAHEGGGPDIFSEGLVRTLVDGKIAYLDERLEIALAPGYDWGWGFENGRALVCDGCHSKSIGEHSLWVGGKWAYIDQKGKNVVPWQDTREQAHKKMEELDSARSATDGSTDLEPR